MKSLSHCTSRSTVESCGWIGRALVEQPIAPMLKARLNPNKSMGRITIILSSLSTDDSGPVPERTIWSGCYEFDIGMLRACKLLWTGGLSRGIPFGLRESCFDLISKSLKFGFEFLHRVRLFFQSGTQFEIRAGEFANLQA